MRHPDDKDGEAGRAPATAGAGSGQEGESARSSGGHQPAASSAEGGAGRVAAATGRDSKPRSSKTRPFKIYKRSDLEVGDRLGGGSYGCVWEATLLDSGISAVVKVVWPDPDLDGPEAFAKSPPSKEVLESFRREIQIFEAVGLHPNVVRMHGASSDCTVIVLEEALTDLYYLLKKQKQPIKLDMVIRWSRDILEGVDFLHRRKIVHRDLKSGNILVFPNRVVKICDFGLARGDISEEMDIHREIVTLWYRAPELLMGIKNYGPRVDEWSVGCIILEMLCGMCIIPGNNKDICDCQKATHINFNSDQLVKVLKLVGTPTDEKLLSKMHCYEHFKSWPVYPARLSRVVENMCTEDRCGPHDTNPAATASEIAKNMYDVLKTLLDSDPWRRSTARDAVNMPLFARLQAETRPSQAKDSKDPEDDDAKRAPATVHRHDGQRRDSTQEPDLSKLDLEPRTRHTHR